MGKAKCNTGSSFSEQPISSRICPKKGWKKDCTDVSAKCVVLKKCDPCYPEPCCESIDCSEGEHPANLCCKLSPAVIKVESAFVFTTQSAATIGAGVTLVHTDIFTQGNGFFTNGHYIICPAHLVIIPPTFLANANRYPFVSTTQPGPSGFYPTTITAASRIMVTVNNVNNSPYTYVYEAELRGVDGAGNIAVLRINKSSLANVNVPCIEKCHPYLCFGHSKKMKCGEVVYGLGNPMPRWRFGVKGLVEGTVVSNGSADEIGFAQSQQFVASFPAFWRASGIPIIDKNGAVVAMQTLSETAQVPIYDGTTHYPAIVALPYGPNGHNQISGPAQHFMKRVIQTLIEGNCGSNRGQLVTVSDSGVPPYVSYRKGFVGFSWRVVSGMDLFTTTINNGGNIGTQLNFVNNMFTPGPICKEIVGVRVLATVGGPTFPYVSAPGGPSAIPFPTLPISPIAATIVQDDIITHMNGVPLGNDKIRCGGHPPASVLWNLIGNGNYTVDITYRKHSDGYQGTYNVSVTVIDTPGVYDYPYENLNNIPLLTGALAPPVANGMPSATFYPAV